MKRGLLTSLILPAALVAGFAAAAGLKLESAWARSSPPGAQVAAVYLRIDNSGGKSDRLLTIRSDVAASAEVHRTTVVEGVARMRPVSTLHVGANEVVAFEPGGLHIMLFGLKQPLVAGESFRVELGFELSGKQQVTVKVREN
ncbi:MAG TPA: copper chaperone PCu(A)C [Steroidobacteraceae bacterium]|nr:copper chaperone PCu(A)C [Steroidobacteraceae bacterium]